VPPPPPPPRGAPASRSRPHLTQGQQAYPAAFPGSQQVYQHQYAYPQHQQQQLAPSQQEQLRAFWQGQLQEVQQVGNDPAEFKNHQLPLARIKKVRRPA
jgi:nuclear transcription factor Y gamma